MKRRRNLLSEVHNFTSCNLLIFHVTVVLFLVLSAVAKINQAVDVGNPERTYKALSDDDACVSDLDESNAENYQKTLASSKAAKTEVVILNRIMLDQRFLMHIFNITQKNLWTVI